MFASITAAVSKARKFLLMPNYNRHTDPKRYARQSGRQQLQHTTVQGTSQNKTGLRKNAALWLQQQGSHVYVITCTLPEAGLRAQQCRAHHLSKKTEIVQ
jgi:hypothetical protein